MMSLLDKFFPPRVDVSTSLPPSIGPFDEVIDINRRSLTAVDNWIDEVAFSRSCFEYGVPGFIRAVINKPINRDLTYSDLMLRIAKKYFDRVNYLEIGVSVGKNFYQMLNAGLDAQFTAFDIEEINPVLEKRLNPVRKSSWDSLPKSIKKQQSSLAEYVYQQKQVNYLSADVWDERSWAKLEGQKFNLVFSDALHTPKAILFEFEMLVKYNLLDDKFVMLWDDLVGKMQYSFYRILKKYDKKYQVKESCLVNINGWVGEHEAPHTIGLIANFSF